MQLLMKLFGPRVRLTAWLMVMAVVCSGCAVPGYQVGVSYGYGTGGYWGARPWPYGYGGWSFGYSAPFWGYGYRPYYGPNWGYRPYWGYGPHYYHPRPYPRPFGPRRWR